MSLEINNNDQSLDTSTIKLPNQKLRRTVAGLLTTMALYSGSIMGSTKAESTEIDRPSISSSMDYEDPNTVVDIPECYRFHVAGIIGKEENEPITIKDLESITDEYFRINLREDSSSLDFLKYCKNATNLTLYGMVNDTTILQTVPDLPNIKTLYLATTINDSDIGLETPDNLTVNSRDFAFLNKMTNLEELEIYGYSVETGVIERLSSLKKLSIYTDGNYDLDFSKLTFLNELSFRHEQIYTIAKDFTLEDYKTLTNSGVKLDFNEYELQKFYEINKKIANIIDEIGITRESTDQEKLDAILIYVLDNLEYDEEVAQSIANNVEHRDLSTSFYEEGLLYGALEKETSICGNYAALVDALARRVDLPTYYARSNNHAWNIVEVEGDSYYVDPTWLDGESIYTSTTTEEVIDGKKYITTSYIPTFSQELIKNNNTQELKWYMADPTDYNDEEQHESHDVTNVPTYIKLVPLVEENRFEMLEPEPTIEETKADETPYEETSTKEDTPQSLDEKKFEISIGNRKWVIGGAVAVGIMSGLGGAEAINNHKKQKERERRRRQQLYDNPYNCGMFDDFDSPYSNTNNRRY